jgi:hypothetical protein
MFLQQMNSFDYSSLKTIQLMAQRDVSTLDESFNVRLLRVGMSQMNMSPKTFTKIPTTKFHLNMSSSSSNADDRIIR